MPARVASPGQETLSTELTSDYLEERRMPYKLLDHEEANLPEVRVGEIGED